MPFKASSLKVTCTLVHRTPLGSDCLDGGEGDRLLGSWLVVYSVTLPGKGADEDDGVEAQVKFIYILYDPKM